MITIVDYGLGNLQSVQRAFEKVGFPARLSSRPEEIEQAEKLVLPGVGSFAACMDHIRRSGLAAILNQKVREERTPLLGICLGLQLMTKFSEEGDSEGFGWIEAETKRFAEPATVGILKIPHLGWSSITIRRENPLLENLAPDPCFYFAHSYCVTCADRDAVVATTEHGVEFVSAIHKGLLFGTQFHPEKSHSNGLQVISNFARATAEDYLLHA